MYVIGLNFFFLAQNLFDIGLLKGFNFQYGGLEKNFRELSFSIIHLYIFCIFNQKIVLTLLKFVVLALYLLNLKFTRMPSKYI